MNGSCSRMLIGEKRRTANALKMKRREMIVGDVVEAGGQIMTSFMVRGG